MRIHIRSVIWILWLSLTLSCDVGEDSCAIILTDITIAHIKLDTDMPPYESLSNSLKKETLQPDRRFIIAVFSQDGIPLDSKIITVSDINQTSYLVNVTFSLPKNKYRLVFWSDYVTHDSEEDLSFDTRDLSEIVLKEPYYGNSELKDAYTAYEDIDLNTQVDIHVVMDITLRRPFAKYQIIASDLSEFMEKENAEVEEFTTKINYTGSTYESYNAVEGHPGNIGSGMTYTGTAKILSANQLLLAWDYIWAEENVLKTTINMLIVDRAGNVVNTVSNVQIPYVRAKFTTITGAFLTDKQDTGIGIITEYEGDINVPLP